MAYTGEQKKEYQRLWLAKRRKSAIEYLGGRCAECGTSEQLEFDHVDRSLKSFNINKLLSRRWEVLKEELDKCQLLCRDHHIEKTSKEVPEWRGDLIHGTHSMYSTGCRCVECREAHTILAREYRDSGKKW